MNSDTLFTPLTVGAITIPNRVVMAPLTRLRSQEPGDIPTPLMAEYYGQRAGAGLIISEATQVSFEAKGYAGAPGIHTPEQMAGWKKITSAVHDKQGHVVCQLWHTGRISHTSLQPGYRAPGAPSAISSGARTTLKDPHGNIFRAECSTPRELSIPEIRQLVTDFGQATENARSSGFDLVELHAAHGYLLHQFLTPEANTRTDQYGGSIENRARLPLEVLDEAIKRWSADRIGFRMYPIGAFNGVDNKIDQEEASLYLIRELTKRNIAYLHISEPDWVGGAGLSDEFRKKIRNAFPGTIIAAGAYTKEKAEKFINAGLIDAAAFGRAYIANPDLAERIAQNGPYNTIHEEYNYTGGAIGYIDYPTLKK